MKKVTIKTPVKDLKKSETIEHYNAVLLEDIKSKMEQVIEGTESTKVILQKEVGEFREEVNGRFEIVENVLKNHSDILNKHTNTLQKIGNEMSAMENRLSGKIDDAGSRIDDHETRITKLETAHP